MKVFLTGGTGVVGTRALPALVADGHDGGRSGPRPEKAELVRRLGGSRSRRRPVRRRRREGPPSTASTPS